MLNLVEIPAGHFSEGDGAGHWDEKPPHDVSITRAFRLGACPISNALFEQFDPEHKKYRGLKETAAGDDDPVRFVSWNDANKFCAWLSRRDGIPYRLPTEAEWEYAFRSRPDSLQRGRDVENWCSDWYGPYQSGPQTDPGGYETGEVRVVRGGSWRAPETPGVSPNVAARLGDLPDDRNMAVGLRVAQGIPAPQTLLKTRPTPRWAQDVSQHRSGGESRVDMTKPYFAEPVPYVKIPPGSSGPLFSQHDHDPALVACPNGDLLAIWYSCNDESGRELLLAASRLRRGHDSWDDADVFWDVPGRNDHAPALWASPDGTLYHFNGLAAEGGWQELALIVRNSRDNGVTWSPARFLDMERTRGGNQPIPSTFQASDGAIYLPSDATPAARGGSVLHVSRDGGRTWPLLNKGASQPPFTEGGTGPWIAGIHTGVAEWTNGSLAAVGRGDEIDGHLALSISHDEGSSWTYSATPFPGIGGGQRPVLRRLKEGALLISFTPGSEFRDAQGRAFTGHGMFAALSYNGGQTWSVRKLLTDGKTRALDGRGWTHEFMMDATHAEPAGYLTAVQTPDGMIHLISSGIAYHFNVSWLRQPNE